ncbi:hypothetical protein [Anaerocellum danielii]|uniref:Uncharacterized protein n=1 Tax=Anaerocellum danielii TaxID=1387557 RepID=A0ABZ0U3B9_9FIRM|nr:hypothetical protein [Caldicellulosiruptor danielii]WPX08195.1 hypothetical protein SOJ16_002061 [Caldicellulosiruptor danielii]
MNKIKAFCLDICPYGQNERSCKVLSALSDEERCPAWLFARYLKRKAILELDTGEDVKEVIEEIQKTLSAGF